MNNTEPRPLLKLYELLWEQIKGQNKLLFGLCCELREMRIKGIITYEEQELMEDSIFKSPLLHGKKIYMHPLTEKGTEKRKSFVQQQIEKLKNKE